MHSGYSSVSPVPSDDNLPSTPGPDHPSGPIPPLPVSYILDGSFSLSSRPGSPVSLIRASALHPSSPLELEALAVSSVCSGSVPTMPPFGNTLPLSPGSTTALSSSLSRPLPTSSSPPIHGISPLLSPSETTLRNDTFHILANIPSLATSFPLLADRWSLYDSFVPQWVPALLDRAALVPLLDALPSYPGSFFPSHPDVLSHSLHSAHGLFSVQPSSCVPGEYGLFSRTGLSPHPTDHILGCYTGWVHAFEDGDSGYPPFTSPVFDMYSLDIGQGLIATAFDSSLSHAQRSYIFPLSFANEYIWHPDGNLLHFEDRGTVILRSHAGIPEDQEVFMSFGPLHDWSPLRHSLMTRLLSTLAALATAVNRPDWSALLTPYILFLPTITVADLLASSSPSLRPLLLILAVVDWYSPHSLSGHIHPQGDDTLGAWIVRCARVRLISIHHVFRKADHPRRPPYHLDTLLPELLATVAPPDRTLRNRALRPLASLRTRSFLHDPQDPSEDFLAEHFFSASPPEIFYEVLDWDIPPSLDIPWPTPVTVPSVAGDLNSDPIEHSTPPPTPSIATPLSPYASLPLILSPTRPLRPSPRPGGLLVALALSYERPSDCARIIQLLRHFAVVVGVSTIPPPLRVAPIWIPPSLSHLGPLRPRLSGF